MVFTVDDEAFSNAQTVCADGGNPDNLLKPNYGDVVNKLGFSCSITQAGVDCQGPAGGGFHMSRADWTTW